MEKKEIVYELKIGKDGFVRHKPCFYTQIMKEEQEAMELFGIEMQRLYKDKIDAPEWKELCRWFLNDAKNRFNKAKTSLDGKYGCVGKTTCSAL